MTRLLAKVVCVNIAFHVEVLAYHCIREVRRRKGHMSCDITLNDVISIKLRKQTTFSSFTCYYVLFKITNFFRQRQNLERISDLNPITLLLQVIRASGPPPPNCADNHPYAFRYCLWLGLNPFRTSGCFSASQPQRSLHIRDKVSTEALYESCEPPQILS